MDEEFENELIAKLNATLDEIINENPKDYSGYIKKVLEFIKENEEDYHLAVNASDLTVFASTLKSIFSKRMVVTATSWGFSPDYENAPYKCIFLSVRALIPLFNILKKTRLHQ